MQEFAFFIMLLKNWRRKWKKYKEEEYSFSMIWEAEEDTGSYKESWS